MEKTLAEKMFFGAKRKAPLNRLIAEALKMQIRTVIAAKILL